MQLYQVPGLGAGAVERPVDMLGRPVSTLVTKRIWSPLGSCLDPGNGKAFGVPGSYLVACRREAALAGLLVERAAGTMSSVASATARSRAALP